MVVLQSGLLPTSKLLENSRCVSNVPTQTSCWFITDTCSVPKSRVYKTKQNSRVHLLLPSGFLIPKYPMGQEARHTPIWRMSLRSRYMKSLGLHLMQPLYSEHRSQPLEQDGGPSVLTVEIQGKQRIEQPGWCRKQNSMVYHHIKTQFSAKYEF